jgi:hypothetical protein
MTRAILDSYSPPYVEGWTHVGNSRLSDPLVALARYRVYLMSQSVRRGCSQPHLMAEKFEVGEHVKLAVYVENDKYWGMNDYELPTKKSTTGDTPVPEPV